MFCPKCNFEQPDGREECLRCGIIFARYKVRKPPAPDVTDAPSLISKNADPQGITDVIKDFLFPVGPAMRPVVFVGRVLVYAGIVFWGVKFVMAPLESDYVGTSFMHLINLPFHEAGHIIFQPFGRFLTVLGGSFVQLAIPFLCMSVFLFRNRDAFAASIGLWWLAQNFMDLAPYINDARDLKLPLLGGVTGLDAPDYHDWEYLLRTLGWLRYDHTFAHASYNLGICLMLIAFLWGGSVLFRQFKNVGAP